MLVGGWPTPLKNMSSSVGIITFPIYGKIKHVPNHQPVYVCLCWHVIDLWHGFQSFLNSAVIFHVSNIISKTSEKNHRRSAAPISKDIQGYPLVNFHIWKITIEIVSFPMKNGGSFHRFLLDYQRLSTDIPPKDHLGQVVLEVTAMIIHRLPISQRSSSPNRNFLYNG